MNGLAKQLRNVGPKLAAKLIEAGIDSPEKLREIGAKKAFNKRRFALKAESRLRRDEQALSKRIATPPSGKR
jgi:hypothetical protein